MKRYPIILPLLLLCLTACTAISEDERLIEVKPANVVKAVLVEEFTGQRCVNCPNAAVEIERLQEQYGADNVVSVAIHSGPLALFSNEKMTGLRTELGDTYYDHWQVEAEPTAVVDRKGGVMTLNQWAAAVYEGLQQESSVSLTLGCRGVDEVTVTVEALVGEPVVGHLQLWVTEDSIVAPQMMPDGTLNQTYVHHHVLRAAVNGPWGTAIDWPMGLHSQDFTFRLQPEWNAEKLSVVAFVYDERGVLQVTRKDI